MSLLKELPYDLYKELTLSNDWSTKVAAKLNLSKIKTAKDLIIQLDKNGYTLKQFYNLLNSFNFSIRNSKIDLEDKPGNSTIITLKIAILVGNCQYHNWNDLITPLSDCNVLGDTLKDLGFLIIQIKNIQTDQFRRTIEEISLVISSNSYIIFYFAGHGFELCGTKYMLGVESPSEKYTIANGISENFVIKNGFLSKPELFILLLDMCRTQPDRNLNEEIYHNINPAEEYKSIGNLIIGYATSPYMPAYEECCQTETTSHTQHETCTFNYKNKSTETLSNNEINLNESDGIGNLITHKLKLKKPQSGISLYTSYLSRHLKKNEDFIKILDMVHKDFAKLNSEQAILQKPQKLDNISKKFYLTQRIQGDLNSEENIKTIVKQLFLEGIDISIK